MRRTVPDSQEMDIGVDSNGNLDIAALLAWCGSGDGYIRAVYDQTGGAGTAGNTAEANQPQVVAAGNFIGYGGRAAGRFVSSRFLGFNFLANQPTTWILPHMHGALANNGRIFDTTTSNLQSVGMAAGKYTQVAGNTVQTVPIILNQPALAIATFAGPNSDLEINGVSTTTNLGTNSTSPGAMRWGASGTPATFMNGFSAGLIAFRRILSPAEKTIIRNNFAAYHGVAIPA